VWLFAELIGQEYKRMRKGKFRKIFPSYYIPGSEITAPFFTRHKKREDMKTTRREIAIEWERVVVVKASKKLASVACKECGLETSFVAIEQAHLLAAISLRRTICLIEEKRLHFFETTDGRLFICLTSLLEYKIKGDCK
jgi:hypothetical protein